MDFPTILLIGVFVVIIAAAFPILAHMGPIPLEHDQPNDFESRLRESRARNAAGRGALAVAGAQAGTTKVDLRKKKDQGDNGGGPELVTLGDSDSDGGSSCGGSDCGD